ncbi:MAG: hypothetical protein WBO10_05050 [Pyrinomonadaceae bacterium]
MKVHFALILMIVSGVFSVAGQEADLVAGKKAEMKKLEKMAGQWKGSGWIQRGPTRETFAGMETVQSKLDGLTLLVEGNFVDPKGKIIHQTLAVLSANHEMSGYDFSTYLANGNSGMQEFKIVGDHYEWGFQIPNVGAVRYTIKIDEKTWFEIGEFSRDGGKTWMKNFEMSLVRVK